jgi:hypothetical protein
VDERYRPWKPLDGTDGEFSIVWFEHRPATGVVLEVERLSGGPVLRVWFDDAIAFRKHPHDVLMVRWWESHSFYRVQGSSWVAWLERESQGIWQAVAYSHYGCKTVDGCYEVLSAAEPRAEWIAPELSLNPARRTERIQAEPKVAPDCGGIT